MFNKAGLDLMDLKTYKLESNVIKSRINAMREQRNNIIKEERHKNNRRNSVQYKNYMSKGVFSRLYENHKMPKLFNNTNKISNNNLKTLGKKQYIKK